MKTPKVAAPATVALSVRKPIIVAAMLLIVVFFIPVVRIITELSGDAVIGAAGAAVLLGWYLIVCVQVLRARIAVEVGAETVRILKNGEAIFEGPYFAARRTMFPHVGIAFAIAPLPITQSLSMNFSNTFVVSAGRNRLTLPGGMLKGLGDLWAVIPDDKKR